MNNQNKPLVNSAPLRPFREEFYIELKSLINKHSVENLSNTPDYILAEYIIKSLENFELTSNKRLRWHQGNLKVTPKGLNDTLNLPTK